MGVQINTSRGSRRRLNSEINITPFVDVMLVLLVIFMVTAPMLISGIEVDLPKTKAGQIKGNDEPLVISVDKGGNFYIQESLLKPHELLTRLSAVMSATPQIRIFIKGDQNINYGKVIELFALVKEVGFTNVALVTEIDQRQQVTKKKLK
jgi:biopolymer transport protein TolR